LYAYLHANRVVKFRSDLIQNNDYKLLNSNSNIESKEINSIINDDNNNNNSDENKINENEKLKKNDIMYRLSKISHLNTKVIKNSDEDHLKDKITPNKKHNKLNLSSKGNRRKKFKIEVIRGWESINGLSFNNFNEKGFIEDKEYQKNLISNQIDIIMDNTNYFKLNYINILAAYIKNDDINIKFLIILNK
jgi:hypothetical protein